MASGLVKRLFWITCFAAVSYAFPSIDGNGTELYLKKFGYLEESADQETIDIRDHEAVLTAIKDSEEFASLRETGELNNERIPMMNVSRCDVKNKTGHCVRNKRSTPEGNLLCTNSSIDTMTRVQNGEVYVFQGDKYWKIHNKVIPEGYPKNISNDWDGLEGPLDASFTTHTGETLFFKGSQFWRFINKIKQNGYPKPISLHFKGIPNDVDAAISFDSDRQIYFFKGTQYWFLNRQIEPPVQGYPQPIDGKFGVLLKNGIDAAYQSPDRRLYFFKKTKYFEYDISTFSVVQKDPQYPQPSGPDWFGCR